MAHLAVRQLTLSHFRSHKRAVIETDGRPIAIYGPNGAGKTNILEAISMLSPGRGLRRAKTAELARVPETVGWKVSAILDSLGHSHELETSFMGEGSRSVSIDGKSAPQIALGRLARVVWLVPVMDRLWIEGADGRRRFLDRLAMSFEPSHGEQTLIYERAMRERNRMLKDGITDPSWYGAVETQMADAGAQIAQNRLQTITRISVAQDSATTGFPAAKLTLVNGDNAQIFETANDLRDAFADGRRRDMQAGRTLVGPHRDDLNAIYAAKDVPAAQCSTGEQKALLVSLILSNARALAQDFGAAPIILLDEVGAHLDADRRAALYDEICALGAQAWMTGTGAELFDSLGNRAKYLMVDDGATSAIHPMP
ncbi:DNA replication and repair protein RecF [Amylibacter ulvae]|uniref:DNA replication and repair protein RecF n=1 Tax=Paramylibacter ulvae TaxID=1651968 RepID=A0ABQ3CY41_9RHOB|nr:DNA replication/repair protein RecF [Amylibacter ulvae]GHA46897.1 DNA replication and repair protein RecF [Amylibacter ulvae]